MKTFTCLQQYHNFGDMIKMALSRCRDANPMAWCRTVVLSLQQLFESHLEDNGGYVDQTAHDWADLKVGESHTLDTVDMYMYYRTWPRSLL